MAKIETMPDGPAPEIAPVQTPPPSGGVEVNGAKQREGLLGIAKSPLKRREIVTNALLPDPERLQAASETLKTPLTPKQEEGLLKAHHEGEGERGKDNTEAGVFNYTPGQLKRKGEILKEAGFTKEQRRTILESGLAGILPPREFSRFNPNDYAADVRLNRVATQIKSTGDAGRADEEFFNRTSLRVERLVDEGVVDEVLALQMLNNLEGWRIHATSAALRDQIQRQHPEQTIERRQGSPSEFEQSIIRIQELEKQPPSTDRDIALQEAMVWRDRLLKEAERLGLLETSKESLFKLYYLSRVEVTYRDKVGESRTDGRGRGVLRELAYQQQVADNGSWESSTDLWTDPAIKAIEDRYAAGGDQIKLEDTYGGVIDYFNRESLKLITEVVENRKKYLDPHNRAEYKKYPRKGIVDLWKYSYRSPNGSVTETRDFNDVRDIVEGERKRKPSIPNRGDYESWLALVAEDPEEAEELIPYIVGAIEGKLDGDPNAQSNTIQEEGSKWAKAIDYLRIELHYEPGDPKFRRLKTMLEGEIKLMAVDVFSDLVNESWDPYLQFEGHIARMFKDTRYQDHAIDTLVLDREGIKFAALELYAIRDWEIYRYGENTRFTPETFQIEDGLRYQQERKDWIENWLVHHELRSMKDLLNLDDNWTSQGDPNHPAFQRLKTELDALDNADPQHNQPGFKTRWQEYIEKAKRWEQIGESSDPRDKRQRVIFQHPLARAFRSKGFTDAQGNVTQIDEFWTMFKKTAETDERVLEQKRQRVKRAQRSAERLLRFSMSEHVSGGPRHVVDDVKKDAAGNWVSPFGKVIVDAGVPKELEISPSLKLPITINAAGEAHVDQVLPHEVLKRKLMLDLVKADSQKPPKRRVLKMFELFKKIIGIDLAQPATDGWYWGAHDTNRPHILKYIQEKMPEFAQMLKERQKVRDFDGREGFLGYGYGGDPKTVLSRVPEDERRLDTLMEIYIKEKFNVHFNYPGQDDPEGGLKEFKNLIYEIYGISGGTVEVNSMIKNARLGEQDILHAFGCSTWREFIGLLKGPNEVVFQRTRGFFAQPRDAQQWVKRFGSIVEQAKLWVGGGKEAAGALIEGFVSGAYNFRALNRDAGNFETKPDSEELYKDPDRAYNIMVESGYKNYVDTAVKVIRPMMMIMESRFKLENVYGRNPQTALFLNTLLWYEVCKWMEDSPDEFRQKFGFAYDVDLPLARVFMHTALYESRLIYSDAQWDQIMLGYTIPKEQWDAIQNGTATKGKPVQKAIRYAADAQGNTIGYKEATDARQKGDFESNGKKYNYDPTNTDVVEGEIVEGLLDAFPPKVREEILEKKWFPIGMNSYKPESIHKLEHQLHTEGYRTKEIYEKVFKQAQNLIEPRRKVVRV